MNLSSYTPVNIAMNTAVNTAVNVEKRQRTQCLTDRWAAADSAATQTAARCTRVEGPATP